jgi:aspartyl-tRNA(Asn)/glutamyl-tRNA(Gln) amidotransferase subunit B
MRLRDKYEVVIGLEVHAQLKTNAKIFCGCSTRFGDEPNSNTCPVCLGLPGALPVLNREAVRMAGKAALALGCRINPVSIFARKNYFYPDLPKGYQISQYDRPFSEHGLVESETGERDEHGRPLRWERKQFRLTRLHIEEDAGKSIHDGSVGGDDRSSVDLNRSGVPLAEIVSEPDFRSSWEAYDYVQFLRQTLQYIGVCDGNMEEGNLRCDANVSVRLKGVKELGTKIELKNLNSFRFLQRALEYEIDRQIEVLEAGGQLRQETRLWNEREGKTAVMRTKEYAHDYRYFPEPDLPPLVVAQEWIEELLEELPELPGQRRRRFVEDYGLSFEDASTLTATREMAEYYEAVVQQGIDPRSAANWIISELVFLLKDAGQDIVNGPVAPENLAGLIKLIDTGSISGKMAKSVIQEMFNTGKTAQQVVTDKGLSQLSDPVQLQPIIDKILAANADQVTAYRAGREQLFGFFVGQVMKATSGQANPQLVHQLLRRALATGPEE